MENQIVINKQFGFWGTLKCHAKDTKELTDIWNAITVKLMELYPEKTEQDIVDFLNSRCGRHFADNLLDNPSGFIYNLILIKITMLNKIKMNPWMMATCTGIFAHPGIVNERPLYMAALKSVKNNKKARAIMCDMIGCNTACPFWSTPEQWLESENVSTQELKDLWAIIQAKVK